jgi:hypothetical protein
MILLYWINWFLGRPQAAAKKIQIIFADLIIAACSPGAVSALTSGGLHFGQNLSMNFRE